MTDIQTTMTMQYLRDMSLILTIVSAVREGHSHCHFEAERQFLKLVFAFDMLITLGIMHISMYS